MNSASDTESLLKQAAPMGYAVLSNLLEQVSSYQAVNSFTAPMPVLSNLLQQVSSYQAVNSFTALLVAAGLYYTRREWGNCKIGWGTEFRAG